MSTLDIKKNKSSKTGNYSEAVGRRKTSVARVRISSANKREILVNGVPVHEYFKIEDLQQIVASPLESSPSANKILVSVRVTGGGIHSQAEAIALGLARVLVATDSELRLPLKKRKLLRRDPRMKERRKFGLKKARKAPQWSKR